MVWLKGAGFSGTFFLHKFSAQIPASVMNLFGLHLSLFY